MRRRGERRSEAERRAARKETGPRVEAPAALSLSPSLLSLLLAALAQLSSASSLSTSPRYSSSSHSPRFSALPSLSPSLSPRSLSPSLSPLALLYLSFLASLFTFSLISRPSLPLRLLSALPSSHLSAAFACSSFLLASLSIRIPFSVSGRRGVFGGSLKSVKFQGQTPLGRTPPPPRGGVIFTPAEPSPSPSLPSL